MGIQYHKVLQVIGLFSLKMLLGDSCVEKFSFNRVFRDTAISEAASVEAHDVTEAICVTLCHRLYSEDCWAAFYNKQNMLCSIYNSLPTCVTPRNQPGTNGFGKFSGLSLIKSKCI